MNKKLLDLDPLRRDAILNAALKEFVKKGYDNASTNVIAKEAGISKALMFHYVTNKQELYLCINDYFTTLLDKEYFMKMDFTNTDIFNRLRQSFLLQIDLIKHYPWIFEFSSLSDNKQLSCHIRIFEMIDVSKFRAGLNIEMCKQFILWSNIGFTNEILDDIKNPETSDPDYNRIVLTIDQYLDELRKIFYTSSYE